MSDAPRLRPDRGWIPLLVAGLVTFGVWIPTLSNGFVAWDDDINFLRNEHYRGLAGSNLKWMFAGFEHGHYQPLTWVTLAFDHLVSGMNPFGYHLTSVVLHA